MENEINPQDNLDLEGRTPLDMTPLNLYDHFLQSGDPEDRALAANLIETDLAFNNFLSAREKDTIRYRGSDFYGLSNPPS